MSWEDEGDVFENEEFVAWLNQSNSVCPVCGAAGGCLQPCRREPAALRALWRMHLRESEPFDGAGNPDSSW